MHAGGPVGDVYTANNYLCLTSLQEREEWLSSWAKDGDMPVLMVEFGTPLYVSFHRGRRGYGQANTSEPLYTEFCAIYQGPEAYHLESPAYRAAVGSTFDKQMLWKSWHGVEVPAMHEGFNQLQALFEKNTWRSWRTWGITGGMVPWGNGHGWLKAGKETANDPLPPFKPGQRGAWKAEAPRNLTRYFRPEGMPLTVAGKALVAGAPDFVDKTHHVRAGTTLAKQVALINDSRNQANWSLTWRAELDGALVAEGSEHGVIAPTSIAFAPLAVPIPATLKSDRVPGVISLTCTIGEAKHTDSFAFTAFAAKAAEAAPAPQIALLDPVGDTTALLRTLGIATSAWDGTPTKSLVVIGRDAFGKGGADPSILAGQLKSGGRALMMAQNPAWLHERLGLRVAKHLARRAFPVIANHPALAGLDAEAIRDWAGESRLVEPIDAPNEAAETPSYGWRWGARHVVSSAPIEIPHRAGWRPILACEFDGAYTPLAEISLDGGALTICTLDLEDHAAADPAAERMARAVIAAAAAATPEARDTTSYLGGDAGSALLDASGIAWKRATTLPQQGTVVIGADASIPDADLDAFLRRGGRALILPRATVQAPLGVRLEQVALHAGSLNVPDWPSCRGIWPGELRRRVDGPAWIVVSGADAIGADGLLAEVRRGKGVAVFCQLDSAMLDADHLSYNRYTRWRWTRVLSQLISNLGGLCVGDNRLVLPAAAPEEISLSGKWKALLTTPMAQSGVNDPHPEDPGISAAARARIALDADESGMQEVPVSRQWRDYGGAWAKADGEAIFRRVIDIPAEWAGKDLTLSLGVVDDFDSAYFDGVEIGATDSSIPNFYNVPRIYTVPGRLVKAGRHAIAVRVFDHFGGGGLVGKAGDLRIFPKKRLSSAPAALYHPDYLTDFPQGDDPYRYYRW
jgi:beta-galactosidase